MTTTDFEAKARKLIADIAAGNLNDLRTTKNGCQQFAGRFFTLVTGQHYLRDGAAGSAKAAYYEMLRDGIGTEVTGQKLLPGDILFWLSGDYGHVAIHVGGGRYVENTVSGRGKPINPKYPYVRSGTDTRSGAHVMRRADLITPAYVGEPRVVVLPMQGRQQVVLESKLVDGTLWVPARAAFEAVGFEVEAKHLPTQGKVYVKEEGK